MRLRDLRRLTAWRAARAQQPEACYDRSTLLWTYGQLGFSRNVVTCEFVPLELHPRTVTLSVQSIASTPASIPHGSLDRSTSSDDGQAPPWPMPAPPVAEPARPHALRIGSDCSGLETPRLALEALGWAHVSLFASDCDARVRRHIARRHPGSRILSDVAVEVDPCEALDVYVAGFPCQPYSSAGLSLGARDERASVLMSCIARISCWRPRCFILENVARFLTLHDGTYFSAAVEELHEQTEQQYIIEWKVLNSADHGLAQNRRRLYIIGRRRDQVVCSFPWPETLPRVSLERFLDQTCGDRSDMEALSGSARGCLMHHCPGGVVTGIDEQVLDIDASVCFARVTTDACPCLLKSRSRGFWLIGRRRRVRLSEALAVQGISAHHLNSPLSHAALFSMAGNAMSQSILERLFVALLPTVGLDLPACARDRWSDFCTGTAHFNSLRFSASPFLGSLGSKVASDNAVSSSCEAQLTCENVVSDAASVASLATCIDACTVLTEKPPKHPVTMVSFLAHCSICSST